jgi:hypothetical protein
MTSTAEKSRTRRVLLAAFAVIAAIGHFLRDVLGFFAESADTDAEKTSSDAARGVMLPTRQPGSDHASSF